MTGELSGRVAIVTGANHGIGAATAELLAARGAAVVASYLRLEDPERAGTPRTYAENRAGTADRLVAAIRSTGGRVLAVEADLSDPATPGRLFDAAASDFGPADILINNASSWRQDSFRTGVPDRVGRQPEPVTADSILHNLAVDVTAAAMLIAEFARRHIARGGEWGRIVGLTSGGPQGFAGEVSYGAAKAAQDNYTMSAATELAPYGVTANMVYPPVTDTGWVTDEVRALVESSAGHMHVAQPAEVAEVIGYLCSDAARLLTGNILHLR
ncbi:MAG: SDR family oxidoreductase [Actinomycetota bacterium]|nr:SDR family oxidoreductase [Actinomycetota bacterium]